MQKAKKMVLGLCLLAGLLPASGRARADQCDDLHEQGKTAAAAANEAITQKNYQQAIAHYEEAAQDYEKISGVGSCRCPLILKNSTATAQAYRQAIADLETHLAIITKYNEGLTRFNNGNASVQNSDFGAAIGEFEAAAMIWDTIVKNYPENANRENAAKNAEKARAAAEQARKILARGR